MNATLDDNNYTSTSCKPFATTTTTTSIHDNNDINQSIQDNSQYEETVALHQLKQNLDSTPYEMKSSLMHAQQVTDIVNDDHLLGFLYAENFNVDVSFYKLMCYAALLCAENPVSFLSDAFVLFLFHSLL